MSDTVKILIVDDESVVRQAFVRILSNDRCIVEAVSNGAIARPIARDSHMAKGKPTQPAAAASTSPVRHAGDGAGGRFQKRERT